MSISKPMWKSVAVYMEVDGSKCKLVESLWKLVEVDFEARGTLYEARWG